MQNSKEKIWQLYSLEENTTNPAVNMARESGSMSYFEKTERIYAAASDESWRSAAFISAYTARKGDMTGVCLHPACALIRGEHWAKRRRKNTKLVYNTFSTAMGNLFDV